MKKDRYTVTVMDNGQKTEIRADRDCTLMEVLLGNGIYIDAPCGGVGLCGKCKVHIMGESVPELTAREKQLLSAREAEGGIRLACLTRIKGDMTVVLQESGIGAPIMSAGADRQVKHEPDISVKTVRLDKPSVDDQRDDLKRLSDALGIRGNPNIKLEDLRQLPEILRDNDFRVNVVYDKEDILSVSGGHRPARCMGAAVDIGTTTVVVYLVDLLTGEVIDVISQLNSQRSFGSDVISRISHTLNSPEGTAQMRDAVIGQISGMIHALAARNGIGVKDIYNIVLAGNTVMLHFVLGLPTGSIANAPYVPVAAGSMVYGAHELGFDMHKACRVFILPSISGYVGADIVAGILASGMMERQELCLLVDIGTNGEIVLGSREGVICCSAAAGPAFEGTNLKHGMGGAAGAINTVGLDKGSIRYTVIGDVKPMGICGSGIIDTTALMVDWGIVDDTGRLLDKGELESRVGSSLAQNLIDTGEIREFVIAKGHETGNGEPIVITQKDIREIQLAKAAIAAGINILIKRSGKAFRDIHRLYLAGGFGSYMDKDNAVRIGLLPRELQDRITVIGNAAGMGALMALRSTGCRQKCDMIRASARYLELSSAPEFQEEYMKCMYFE